MNKKIKFTVPGVPVPKARPRVMKFGTFTPAKTKNYEEFIRECWMQQSGKVLPSDTPLIVRVKAYMPIPTSISKKRHDLLVNSPHLKRGDLDNLIKSVLDGCQQFAFGDDSCVYRLEAEKLYSDEPRMEVEFEAVMPNGG